MTSRPATWRASGRLTLTIGCGCTTVPGVVVVVIVHLLTLDPFVMNPGGRRTEDQHSQDKDDYQQDPGQRRGVTHVAEGKRLLVNQEDRKSTRLNSSHLVI